jgi:phosphopantothenate synthetase
VLIKKPVAVGNGVQVNPTSQPIAMAPTISQKIEVNMELNGNQVKQLREALQSAGQCKVLCREKRTFLPLEAWNVRKWLKYKNNYPDNSPPRRLERYTL